MPNLTKGKRGTKAFVFLLGFIDAQHKFHEQPDKIEVERDGLVCSEKIKLVSSVLGLKTYNCTRGLKTSEALCRIGQLQFELYCTTCKDRNVGQYAQKTRNVTNQCLFVLKVRVKHLGLIGSFRADVGVVPVGRNGKRFGHLTVVRSTTLQLNDDENRKEGVTSELSSATRKHEYLSTIFL